ncbi:NAD-dependent epimerase/dehydratase family protein [Rugosimonospora africana]|uniref:NAD-dependent epimerase n=1 Tax=Rugosimonospora africana TaxID=556532 RepID=A0A8J3R2F8_9ACTN|nr:NAD(P)-dependent oxidoreductase [Rugosimonospora africana]GIH21228.1 NAD-dependent epimerase [Rugosimonospora africana]
MILVTGGLGFIGLNTARALLDAGETCVLTRHRTARQPDFIRTELGRRVFIEQLDVSDPAALLELGRRYPIDGIVHLAGTAGTGPDLLDDLQTGVDGVLAVLRAAREWQIRRLSLASSLVVYHDVAGVPWREDAALSTAGVYPIEVMKKNAELLGNLAAQHTGVEVVSLRIGAIWGPFGRPDSRFVAVQRMVNAAVRGEPVRYDPPRYAEDALDICYARDCGRAIALAQTADKLNHRVYNVGSGRATRNAEVADAVRAVIPDADIELVAGRDPQGPPADQYLDITRLHEDTGYLPEYDTVRGVRDYVQWLRAGERDPA